MPKPPFTRRGFVGTSIAGLAALTGSGRAEDQPTANPFRSPFVYPFHIGEIEAWSISDAYLSLGEGLGLMWPEEQRPEMKSVMEAHGEPASSLPLYVNILVLRHGKEIMLFDAGFGAVGNPRLGWLLDGLALIGIAPEQVTSGFLSHAHSDHLNGFVKNGKPVFPNAAFHVMSTELDFWRAAEPDFSKTKRDQKPLPRMIKDARRNFDILDPLTVKLKDGMELFGGIVKVEAAPGHTAGHACFRIRSGDDELLHLMDLAHHHLLMFADPDWTIAFDHDPSQAILTRKKFWSQASTNHTRCYGFHLPWPGLGRIIPQEKGYRWWAEAWRWER